MGIEDDELSNSDLRRGIRRLPRYESHALIEVQAHWWNPFVQKSAVLLDISWEGIKIEFVSPLKSPPLGAKLRIAIPLAPFGIMSPPKIKLELVIKWFDARNCRAGGVFEKPSPEDLILLERMIHYVAEHSNGKTL